MHCHCPAIHYAIRPAVIAKKRKMQQANNLEAFECKQEQQKVARINVEIMECKHTNRRNEQAANSIAI